MRFRINKTSLLKIAFSCLLIGNLFCQLPDVPAVRKKTDQSFLDGFVRKIWTTKDGLPGMTVTTLIQDRKGYIWIGSYDGLVRFDGVDFNVYNRTVDEKYDFTSARSIIQDSLENIWVGHNDEGVTRIDKNGGIRKFTMEDGLPNNKINALCEDSEGNVWVGTSSGLCVLRADGSVAEPEGLKELGQEKILVSKIFCDSKNRVWVITGLAGDNFVYENGKLSRFTGMKTFENPAVFEIYEDKDGGMWFGVAPHFAVRIKDGEETVYDVHHEGLDATIVNSIMQDSAGNFWFGSDSGVTVMHGNSFAYYDSFNGLSDNGITRIFEDREGNVWVALNRGGLQKFSKGKFRTVGMKSSVNAICEDKSRDVTWLATDSGLYCYKDNEFVENEITKLCTNIRVRNVGMTRDGELLITSYSEIPQIRVKSDGDVKIWTPADGLATIKCRVSIKISNGDYYVGTPIGLSIIHHEDGSVSTLTRKDGFTNHYMMWLYEDNLGRVWVGTNGGGVFVMEDGKITKHYTTEEGLSGNVIFKILENNGSVWIATGTGLSKYDAENDSFVNFNSKNGLGTDSVFQMICDGNGSVWMTSNKGIFSTPLSEIEEVASGAKKKVSVRYYGDSDGLITSGVTSTSLSAMDSRGRIWFTLTDGFAIYDSSNVSVNNIPPRIEIQDYVVDNSKFDYHGEKIVLSPSAKRLSVKFTGLSFISSDSMLFRYRLAGFEDDYSDWSPLRSVSYTNLKPGTYRFTVVAQNSDGFQSDASTPVTIVKKPYIWQMAWFWIAIAFLVVFFIAWKIYSMRRYQIVLEEKVEERTRELKKEKEKSESLLLNILPAGVAKELTESPNKTIAKKYPNVTVLFTDIVGFTKMSGTMSAEEVVTMLNKMISKFDDRAKLEGIEKIKTIGDAYMAAVGLTESAENDGAVRMVNFAKGVMEDVKAFDEENSVRVMIRLGINTGNLVAGVIGKSKFIYDIWGDTVNVASRMESTGEPMKIHVTESTYEQTKDFFEYSDGVNIQVKGKGEMKTYFLA